MKKLIIFIFCLINFSILKSQDIFIIGNINDNYNKIAELVAKISNQNKFKSYQIFSLSQNSEFNFKTSDKNWLSKLKLAFASDDNNISVPSITDLNKGISLIKSKVKKNESVVIYDNSGILEKNGNDRYSNWDNLISNVSKSKKHRTAYLLNFTVQKPTITITTPAVSVVVNQDFLISGIANVNVGYINKIQIKLNNNNWFDIDTSYRWETLILLQNGMNIISARCQANSGVWSAVVPVKINFLKDLRINFISPKDEESIANCGEEEDGGGNSFKIKFGSNIDPKLLSLVIEESGVELLNIKLSDRNLEVSTAEPKEYCLFLTRNGDNGIDGKGIFQTDCIDPTLEYKLYFVFNNYKSEKITVTFNSWPSEKEKIADPKILPKCICESKK